MLLALTHPPSPLLSDCQLTFVDRQTIDFDRAMAQHAAYRELLGECGAQVETWHGNDAFPDSAFVEDLAVVLDELAVLAAMRTAPRRGEVELAARELARWKPIERIQSETDNEVATLEGGDVLRVGKTLIVGRSVRTNECGAGSLARLVEPHGYSVAIVPVDGCLHFKTACCAVDKETLLINPRWVSPRDLGGYRILEVPEDEPFGANVVPLNGRVCLAASHPRTAELLDHRGYSPATVDISELEKAEAGMTCLSLIFESM